MFVSLFAFSLKIIQFGQFVGNFVMAIVFFSEIIISFSY